jgi:hypothetical protein
MLCKSLGFQGGDYDERRVALARTEVSQERIASETSVLKRATWHNIPEDGILRLL